MATQVDVRRIHVENPELTASQIAQRLGCMPEYVRATARRQGLTLANGHKVRVRKPDSLISLGLACRAVGLTVDRIDELDRMGALRP